MAGRAGHEGVLAFRASWRTLPGLVIGVLLAAVALLGMLALGGWPVVAVPALVTALLAWGLGRCLFTRRPYLAVGPGGLGGSALRGHGVPWRHVEDLAQEQVQGQGHDHLVLTLRKGCSSLRRTRSSFLQRGRERRITLGLLRAGERPRALQVALAAFLAYGGEQARMVAEARAEQARAAEAFTRELQARTPHTWALWAVVAVNVGVWAAGVAAGYSPMQATPADLFRWGANSAWAVTVDHEWWRLLTATVLHGGLMHLAMNLLGLWGAGLLLNRLYGNAQFLLLYLASALAGSAASLHFSSQAAVGVGASGAVFGVLGAVLVCSRRHQQRLPALFGRNVLAGQGVFLVAALAQGFGRQGIDNAAHVGGLAMGAALACVLVEAVDGCRQRQRAARAVAATVLAAVVVTALVATTPAPSIDHRRSFAAMDVAQRMGPRLAAAQQALQADLDALRSGRLTDAGMAGALELRHVPAFRALDAELDAVSLPASDPRSAMLADLKRLVHGMTEANALMLEQARHPGDAASAARLQALQVEVREVSERLRAQRERATASRR